MTVGSSVKNRIIVVVALVIIAAIGVGLFLWLRPANDPATALSQGCNSRSAPEIGSVSSFANKIKPVDPTESQPYGGFEGHKIMVSISDEGIIKSLTKYIEETYTDSVVSTLPVYGTLNYSAGFASETAQNLYVFWANHGQTWLSRRAIEIDLRDVRTSTTKSLTAVQQQCR